MKSCIIGKLLCLLLLCVSLSACTVKTSYRFLDWLIAWRVDDYVSLTSTQQPVFDQQLTQVLTWHQATQLPLYRDWLIDAKVLFQQPLLVDDLNRWLARSQGFWSHLMMQLAPASAKLLVLLNDQQVAGLINELRVALADDREDAAETREGGRQEFIKRQSHITRKQFSHWLGDLSSLQEHWIDQWVDSRNDNQRLWLDSREQWLNDFELVLSQRQQLGFETAINRLFIDTQQRRTKAYQVALDENTQSALRLIIKLQASLDERQMRHFNKEIDVWIDVLGDLADQ